MLDFIKKSAKVLGGYMIITAIYLVFTVVFIVITITDYWTDMAIASAIVFMMIYFLQYSTFKTIGQKEKRNIYKGSKYVSKGLMYGIVGMSPILIINCLAAILPIETEYILIKDIIINYLAGPVYFVAKFTGSHPWSFLLANCVVIASVGIGYWAGYTDFYFMNMFKSESREDDE